MLVTKEVKDALLLTDDEMRRRRFLLKKDKRSKKEDRELDILNIRVFLYTSDDLKHFEICKK